MNNNTTKEGNSMEDHFLMFPIMMIIAAGYLVVYAVKVLILLIQIIIKIFSKNKNVEDIKIKGVDKIATK